MSCYHDRILRYERMDHGFVAALLSLFGAKVHLPATLQSTEHLRLVPKVSRVERPSPN